MGAPDINTMKFANLVTQDKKENKLLKKLIRCKTRKCSKINKERSKAVKDFEKKLKNKCTQKDNKLWLNCLKGLDNKYGSKNKTLRRKYNKCGEEKCSKEHNTLSKYQKNVLHREEIIINK